MKLLTPEEVAEILGVNTDTVKRYSRSGELIGLQLGGRWRYQLSDVQIFIDQQKAITQQPRKRKVKAEKSCAELAAELVGVPVSKVEQAGRIIESGIPEIIEAVERGQLDLDEAEEIIKLTKETSPEVATSYSEPIELILELSEKGMKQQAIAEHLNSLGLVTSRGKHWNADSIFRRIRDHKAGQ